MSNRLTNGCLPGCWLSCPRPGHHASCICYHPLCCSISVDSSRIGRDNLLGEICHIMNGHDVVSRGECSFPRITLKLYGPPNWLCSLSDNYEIRPSFPIAACALGTGLCFAGRSIAIDMCFLNKTLTKRRSGFVLFPQNKSLICTSAMVLLRVRLIPVMGFHTYVTTGEIKL